MLTLTLVVTAPSTKEGGREDVLDIEDKLEAFNTFDVLAGPFFEADDNQQKEVIRQADG
jgi:hypothetical protein